MFLAVEMANIQEQRWLGSPALAGCYNEVRGGGGEEKGKKKKREKEAWLLLGHYHTSGFSQDVNVPCAVYKLPQM